MVQPRPVRHQRRRPFPRSHPSSQHLALLVSAIPKKRTLCLSESARAYPTPEEHLVASPKHDLLHRIKRLWRSIGNERVDALGVQTALVPHTIARPGSPRLLDLAIDRTQGSTPYPPRANGYATSSRG